MKTLATTVFAAGLMAAPAFADGHLSEEAAYGLENFGQCQTCHVVEDGDGTVIAGRNAKTGPNLYCMVGRQAGSVEGFRYGKDLVAAGEAGLEWTTEELTTYLLDPRDYLRTYLDDGKARSKMAYKVRKDGDLSAEDVAGRMAAFLAESCADTAS